MEMSGGMDSPILTAMMLPLLDLERVTVYTVDQKESVDTVSSILEYIGCFPDRVTIPDPKNENGALSPVFLQLCSEVDYFYTGINRNPPWANVIPEGQKPKRFNKTVYQNLHMPFGLLEKTDIVALYQRHGRKPLMGLTHTCTERPHGQKACGVCFACRERYWAFKTLGLEDTVKYETDLKKEMVATLAEEMSLSAMAKLSWNEAFTWYEQLKHPQTSDLESGGNSTYVAFSNVGALFGSELAS